MKRVARISLLVAGTLLSIVSLPLIACAMQIHKNKMVLADMQDVVIAIKAFKEKNERLPTQEELSRIEDATPIRYSRYGYHFGSPPSRPDDNYPQARPGTDDWMIWFWRGEWSEWYTSWDNRYSLAKDSSWWGFCGPYLLMPFAAAFCFGLASLKILKTKENKPNEALERTG